jgi:large subunit ribosomal protein L1
MADEASTTEKKGRLGHHGKKYTDALAKVQLGKAYKVDEAFALLPQIAYAKFDETVEAVFNLGVDPKHAEQMVRGAIVLPHGTGKSARIAVVAKGEKAKDAQNAGADHVGAEDLIEKIAGGWLDFDKLIATPDMMVPLSKIGKVLGPKGLMPNPKLGTVTMDVAKAVGEQKKGKIEYRTEKTGIIHVAIGKKSFGAAKLKDNFVTLATTILRAKPPTSKGTYLKKITVSATMSPGILVDALDVLAVTGSA